jgi:hypothetical protein
VGRRAAESRLTASSSMMSASGGSVIATVEPAPVYRRVPYTFAHVPLNAGRLVVSEVASTALQEHQRRSQERGFDDAEHVRPPLHSSQRRGRRHPPMLTEGRRKRGPIRSPVWAIRLEQHARTLLFRAQAPLLFDLWPEKRPRRQSGAKGGVFMRARAAVG